MSSADRTGNSINYVAGRCTAARVSSADCTEGGRVKLECSTPGVSYAYQLNGRGRNGEKHWSLYVEPFAVRKGDRVAVQAFRVGYKKSEIVNFLIEH